MSMSRGMSFHTTIATARSTAPPAKLVMMIDSENDAAPSRSSSAAPVCCAIWAAAPNDCIASSMAVPLRPDSASAAGSSPRRYTMEATLPRIATPSTLPRS